MSARRVQHVLASYEIWRTDFLGVLRPTKRDGFYEHHLSIWQNEVPNIAFAHVNAGKFSNMIYGNPYFTLRHHQDDSARLTFVTAAWYHSYFFSIKGNCSPSQHVILSEIAVL